LFRPERPGYLAFLPTIEAKPAIKSVLEADAQLQKTFASHRRALEAWWEVARDDFALLCEGKKMPDVRHELLTTIKTKLVPLDVLDEFKSAGVFVNWWQQIRYDLKTIVSTGWHHTLIPDEYLVTAFFQDEADAIESVNAKISEIQGELTEAVETAQEVAAYEPEEDEVVTAAVVKKALKELIDDLKGSAGESAQKELKTLQTQEKAISALEKRMKESKAQLTELMNELEHKLQLKRVGGDEFKAESYELLSQAEARIAALDEINKEDKKQIAALQKDKAALQARIDKTDALLAEIGGPLTAQGAKTLILRKLYDRANHELNRYLTAEQRVLTHTAENLWDKYAISNRVLEFQRSETANALNGFLDGLGYR
jgi:type I restriction enzyme M protein